MDPTIRRIQKKIQNKAVTANESVRVIVTYDVEAILWSNKRNLTLWGKGLCFAGHTVWADKMSLVRCKN